MPTVKCFYCERERLLDPTEEVWPFCVGTDCEQEFIDVVYALLDGGTLADLEIAPASLLSRSAIAEVKRLRRAEMIERRSWREHEHERSRPRPMRPLYPC